jgi:hypothetical protein
VVNLLRVAAEPTVDLGIRHIAAITFKNAVKRRWDPEKDGAQWGLGGRGRRRRNQDWSDAAAAPRLTAPTFPARHPPLLPGAYTPVVDEDKRLVRDNMLDALLKWERRGGDGCGENEAAAAWHHPQMLHMCSVFVMCCSSSSSSSSSSSMKQTNPL